MAEKSTTDKILRYIRCTAGSETFALDMDSVYSIQRTDNLHFDSPAPHAIGWFPLREEKVPVYLLSACLAQPGNGSLSLGRVILMNPLPGQASRWGLAVDQVSQVFTSGLEALSPLSEKLCLGAERYFYAVLRQADEIFLMLDPASLHPDRPVTAMATQLNNRFGALAQVVPAEPFLGIGSQPIHQKQLIVFSLPGIIESLQFGLSITQVLEILAPMPVIGLPGVPDYVLGLLNWRQRPVPLIDLAARFGLESQAPVGSPRLMIVRDRSDHSGQVFGFYVHPNMQMLRLPVQERPCSPSLAIPKAFIKGVVEIDGQVTVIPDVSGVLGN